jgi:hypothetical protein
MHRPTAAAAQAQQHRLQQQRLPQSLLQTLLRHRAAAVVAARLYSLRATVVAGGVHRLCIVVQYCCSGCSHMLLCCCTCSRVDSYSWFVALCLVSLKLCSVLGMLCGGWSLSLVISELVALLLHAVKLQELFQAIVLLLLLDAEPQQQVNGIIYQFWVTAACNRTATFSTQLQQSF